jgi:uncharacterized membrane protein required for colicin V production
MQLDIAILIVIAIFTILGFKNGFVRTIFFTCGWFIAIIVAFIMRDRVRGFLTDNTPVYDWYYGRIYDICSKFFTGYTDKLTGGLPADPGALSGGALDGAADSLSAGALNGAVDAVGGAVGAIGDKLTTEAAEHIASASFGVLCFIGTVLVVKLLMFLITLALSRRYRGGFVGALDAFAGIFIGLLQGFIVVFVILILILPVTLALNPVLFEAVTGALNTSFFAKTLFTVNPLISLVDGFAPGLFDPAEWLP